MDFLHAHARAQCLGNEEQPLVVLLADAREKLLPGIFFDEGTLQAVQIQLQGPDGFHQRRLKVPADGHDLARRLHPGAQRLVRRRKLIKGPAGELHHHIIDGGFKAGIGLAGHAVHNLIQAIADGNLRRNLGNGISRSLGGQGRRAADPGVYLDQIILHGLGIQRILHIAAAFDSQRIDDADGGAPEHLVFLVPKRLRRGSYDAVARMDADGIDIFHAANRDAVPLAIPEHFKFDFLIARHGFFDEALVHAAGLQARMGDLLQFFGIMGDAAASSAERIGRADDERIARVLAELQGLLHGVDNHAFNDRLADGLHGFFECFPVLRLFDGIDIRSQKADVHFLQKALVVKLHCEI